MFNQINTFWAQVRATHRASPPCVHQMGQWRKQKRSSYLGGQQHLYHQEQTVSGSKLMTIVNWRTIVNWWPLYFVPKPSSLCWCMSTMDPGFPTTGWSNCCSTGSHTPTSSTLWTNGLAHMRHQQHHRATWVNSTRCCTAQLNVFHQVDDEFNVWFCWFNLLFPMAPRRPPKATFWFASMAKTMLPASASKTACQAAMFEPSQYAHTFSVLLVILKFKAYVNSTMQPWKNHSTFQHSNKRPWWLIEGHDGFFHPSINVCTCQCTTTEINYVSFFRKCILVCHFLYQNHFNSLKNLKSIWILEKPFLEL